ncbi:MAG: transferase [Sphaerospermopsis sp. SIO1G2]|nr:transferase [Sphaerospermopsis sp. SIO1G2]
MTDKIKIFPNVKLGENVIIQDWAIIGLPPPGVNPDQLETIIEDGSVIRSHTVIYAGTKIGKGFQTGHRVVLGPGCEIADSCSVGTSTVVKGFVSLADRAKIHSFCNIGIFTTLQSGAWVGPRCTIEGDSENPVIIASGALLGSTVYVKSGVRVGERSLVGAGVSLQQDVHPYHLVAGKPAKSIKSIEALTCPYNLIERPYEPDPEPIKAAAEDRYLHRSPAEYRQNSWRYQQWQLLGDRMPWF